MAQNWTTLRNSPNLYSDSSSLKGEANEFGKERRIRRTTSWYKSKTYHYNHVGVHIFSCLSRSNSNPNPNTSLKKCLRCNTLFNPLLNSPISCSFHGHITGEKGLFALAPPHQGIDGEWTDGSGVIVYKWNDKSNRPNDGAVVPSMMKMLHPVDKAFSIN